MDRSPNSLPINEHTYRRGDVLHGPERRRRWSLEEKARIVAESLAPGAVAAVNLPAVHVGAPGDFGHHRPRRKGRRNDRPLLLGAPPPPTFHTREDLNPRHCTVPCSAASHAACSTANLPRLRADAEGGLRRRHTLNGRLRREGAQTEASRGR